MKKQLSSWAYYAVGLSCMTFSLLDAKRYCIHQDDIPFAITKPGEYIVKENITYTGSGSAITIQADNVKLEFETSSLFLSDNNATGIFVQNASEFVIESDAITNTSLAPQNGTGIHIMNSTKGCVKDVFTVNHLNGIFIEDSSDIAVKNSQFFNALNADALIMNSINVDFSSCVFNQGGSGVIFNGANQDCSIVKSDFPDSIFSNLLAQQINGLLIEDCTFSNVTGDPAKANLIQCGDAAPEQSCNDVIIKNCTITNRPAHSPMLGNTAPEGLGIYQGSGFLIDSCIIDIDNTDQDPDADLSGIHISNPGLGAGTIASGVIVRDCIIQGPATNGLYPDVGATNIIIENCLVSGASKNGIFLAGTSACTVENNTVTNNGTNGIFIGETSIANAVTSNTVNANGFAPILSSIAPMGNGISIASDSSQNSIQYNTIFANAVNGINDLGTNNQIYNNRAYANSSGNYSAATDIIVVNIPGNPALAAENISA